MGNRWRSIPWRSSPWRSIPWKSFHEGQFHGSQFHEGQLHGGHCHGGQSMEVNSMKVNSMEVNSMKVNFMEVNAMEVKLGIWNINGTLPWVPLRLHQPILIIFSDVTTTDAERSFLLFASTLQTYGVDPYPCKVSYLMKTTSLINGYLLIYCKLYWNYCFHK